MYILRRIFSRRQPVAPGDFATQIGFVSQNSLGFYVGFFGRWRLRSRTPGPPPFSSMNSTPELVPPAGTIILTYVPLFGTLHRRDQELR
jgi:hypothetical protein